MESRSLGREKRWFDSFLEGMAFARRSRELCEHGAGSIDVVSEPVAEFGGLRRHLVKMPARIEG